MFYINGTPYIGYYSKQAFSQSNDVYSFKLFDNEILPASYNINEDFIEHQEHTQVLSLTSNNQFVKNRIKNITNSAYGFLELMANISVEAPLPVIFCNETYTTSPVISSNYCVNLPSIARPNTPDHIHTNYSWHILTTFNINTTTRKIGTVSVGNSGYFLIRGLSSNTVRLYGINNITDLDTVQTTTNGGISWTNHNIVADMHLHQFEEGNQTTINNTLFYYACINDTFNHTNCTSIDSDLFRLGGLPPSAPDVYYPIEGNYTGDTYINWTASISQVGLNYYNVSLWFSNETFVIDLKPNNTLNLSFSFNASNYPDGNYTARVDVFDIAGLNSYGYSEIFTIDQCVWYVANTSWGIWVNTSCVGSYMNYTRNYTLYENVTCNEFANATYYESNLTNIWEYTAYGILVNESCVGDYRNVSQNRTEYDALRCGANTTIVNSTLYAPSYGNTSWSDWYNVSSCLANDTVQQARNITQYDDYLCAANTTFYEYRDQSCNYAAPSITIIYPAPSVTYPSIVDMLNYSVYDYNSTITCWYNINNGTNSSAMSPCVNITNITTIYGWNISAFNGANTWTVYAQDIWGLVGSVTWSFYVNFGATGTGTSDCVIINYGINKNGAIYKGNCEYCRYRQFGYYKEGGLTYDCI